MQVLGTTCFGGGADGRLIYKKVPLARLKCNRWVALTMAMKDEQSN